MTKRLNGNRAYVFDVDGTLTPSRQPMNPEFRQWFFEFEKNNPVYLVTGSDYNKTLEQLGEQVIQGAQYLFNCCGNEVRRGAVLYRSKWKPSQELLDDLASLLADESFPIKTGNHIEIRTGMVNFSIVGRNANLNQRREFWEYDQETGTRTTLAEWLRQRHPDIGVSVAGETGIDIYEQGCHKGQIKRWIKESEIEFWGDRTEPGGNDYEIARLADQVHQVRDWQETFSLLKEKVQ